MSEPSAVIFVVDDDPAIRKSLTVLLEASGLTNVVAYSSADEFLTAAQPKRGDCLVVDIRMPGMDGLELQAELNRRGSKIPVIVMTGHGDVPIAVRAMKAGASDFVEKPFAVDAMIESVKRALELSAQASGAVQENEQIHRRIGSLTPREREVLEGLVAGHPNKVIAHTLGISPRTVEIHRARVMDKLDARNLSTLVRMAITAGIVPV